MFTNNPLSQRSKEEDKMGASDTKRLRGCHILMCEDHPINARIVRMLLEQQGCIVEWAANGQVGLELFEQSKPGTYDAILMDIGMPVLDGLAATACIRRLSRKDAKTVPVIALTANSYQADVQLSLCSGMNAHLSKPVNPKMLYQTLVEQINMNE